MVGRDVQLGEIVIVKFDVRAFGDGEAHIGEDQGDFFQHLGDRDARCPGFPGAAAG